MVEGAPLLRAYGGKTSIEGSNPSLSARIDNKLLIIKVIFEITRFDPQRYPQQVLSLIVG